MLLFLPLFGRAGWVFIYDKKKSNKIGIGRGGTFGDE